jgi:hypothetical protein
MLEEAIQLVVTKTGISKDQATTAVHTVIDLLKQRLPGPLAAQLDGLLAGGGAAGGVGGMLAGLAGGLGGGQQSGQSEQPSATGSVENALGGLFGK